MGYWRYEKLNADTAPAFGGTSIYTLPKAGFLSGIVCRLGAATVSPGILTLAAWRILQRLSKIEVILNGTYDCKSITGEVAEALQFYSQKVVGLERPRGYATGTTWDAFALLFGRQLYDESYGLDLSKYDSVQLKITNDETSSIYGAVHSEEIHGLLFEESPISPKGYIRSREYRSWTSVSDETKYIDLPTEDVLRRCVIQSVPPQTNGEETTSWFNIAYELKYKMRSGKIIMFDGTLDDLLRFNSLDVQREVFQSGLKETTSAYGFRTGVGRQVGIATVAADFGVVGPAVEQTVKETPDGNLVQQAHTADFPLNYLVRGWGPWETAMFNHDRRGDLQDLLDLNKEKQVTLDVHTRSGAAFAGGTIRVNLETLVKY